MTVLIELCILDKEQRGIVDKVEDIELYSVR